MDTAAVHDIHHPQIIGNSPDALGDRFAVECACGHQAGPFLSLRELLNAWGTHLTHETLTRALAAQTKVPTGAGHRR